MKYPQIKKIVSRFLLDEGGRISKRNALTLGVVAIGMMPEVLGGTHCNSLGHCSKSCPDPSVSHPGYEVAEPDTEDLQTGSSTSDGRPTHVSYDPPGTHSNCGWTCGNSCDDKWSSTTHDNAYNEHGNHNTVEHQSARRFVEEHCNATLHDNNLEIIRNGNQIIAEHEHNVIGQNIHVKTNSEEYGGHCSQHSNSD